MKFILTGGGSAGHALPSLRLAEHLRAQGAEVHYLGSRNSIEERLAGEFGVEFHAIPTGKYDRSRKLSVISAARHNVEGISAAHAVIRKIRPQGVFSSGGFVGVPVVVAGRLAGVRRIVVHACDFSSGLANRICLPFVTDLSCTVRELSERSWKGFFVGPIVDRRLLSASARQERGAKPLLLVYGGSQGAAALNEAVRQQLPKLLGQFDVMHVCGAGKREPSLDGVAGYVQAEYVSNFFELLMSADVAFCRAGSNSLWELIVAGVPHLAVPLPRSVSRGDQYENCHYFEARGVTTWVEQDDLADTDLAGAFSALLGAAPAFHENRAALVGGQNAVEAIASRLTA